MPDLERASRVAKDAPGVLDGTLPALRGLAKLADLCPVIVVDSREQSPLTFTRLQSVRGTLYSGDYSILGLEESFAVERKSLDDIANCCSTGRDRFVHELHRLRGYQFKRLLIVGSRAEIEVQRYHSRIAPKAVLATLGAFEIRYDRAGCVRRYAPERSPPDRTVGFLLLKRSFKTCSRFIQINEP
jgi:hypothetical protein